MYVGVFGLYFLVVVRYLFIIQGLSLLLPTKTGKAAATPHRC